MKTSQEWFDEYAVSHQNKKNKSIHYVCVPAIFFSVIGLLMSIPSSFLQNLFSLHMPLLENWAVVIAILVLIFYAKLGFSYFIEMLLVITIAIIGNYWLGGLGNLAFISLLIFSVGWIGQFYGHKIEGKKPSFIKDLQFLLIGPLWVIHHLFYSK